MIMPNNQLSIPASALRVTETPRLTRVEGTQSPEPGKEVAAVGGKPLPHEAAAVASQSSQTNSAPAEKETGDKVKQAVTDIADFVQNISRDLEFSVDEDSGRVIVTVLDSETKEVIRQIPPEEALKLAQNLQKSDSGNGVLFQGNA